MSKFPGFYLAHKPRMKKFLVGIGILLVGSVVALSLMASRFESKVRKGVFFAGVNLGGLTKPEAEDKIANWWKTEGNAELTMHVPNTSKDFKRTPEDLGFVLDKAAIVSKLPFVDFWDTATDLVTADDLNSTDIPILIKGEPKKLEPIREFIKTSTGKPTKARVYYKDGNFTRQPEVSGYSLDDKKLKEQVLTALDGERRFDFALKEAPKLVPDAELNKIAEVMSEFTTSFSTGKVSRSSNIKVATQKLNGIVLAPGEKFSFNAYVGKRTIKAGFKVAGVYKNGKHDVDLGGGICQVSTTLYNACLFSNIDITRRQNHSMPVPYVPLGRDATVDFGMADLEFKNNYDFPIAISSVYTPGKLIFRILGVKDPSLKVEILRSDEKSWAVPGKTVLDPNLAEGRSKVIEKGSSGHSIYTFRVIYKDGVEVKREPLGQSFYRGASRITAVGTRPSASPDAPEQGTPGDTEI